jgi:hypothetical protein
MNAADGFVLALLALADIALMVHLRRRSQRRARAERMMRSLHFAIRREIAAQPAPVQRWILRRAS